MSKGQNSSLLEHGHVAYPIKGNYTPVDGTPSQIPAFELTKASAKFEVATINRLGGDAFKRKYIISLLILTLGQEKTLNVALYPLQHMTYSPAKF